MDHLRIIERIALPEPLSYHAFVRRDGRRGVAVGERSGTVWMLEIDPGARTCEPHPLPISVPRGEDGKEWMVRGMSGSESLDRLLLCSDAPRVYDLSSGALVAELSPLPGRAVCLSADGRWAICLDEGLGATMDLDASVPAWRETAAFHQWEGESGQLEALDLDHVDSIVAYPCDPADVPEGEDHFWLAAGCYGFVATHRVDALHTTGELRRVPGQTRLFGGLVYDPTELLRPPGPRHVLVWHGYGTGLAAVDPATGEQHHCWIRGPRQQPYGYFSGVVTCGTEPAAWGRSRDGAFLWRVGQPPVLMPAIPESGVPLALYPGALLCLSNGGTELLWCELPSPQTPSLA